MRAILSVYDKTGAVELARGLHGLGWELCSTGGTQRALAAAGVPATGVADLTGSPEILGGRVKSLHPKVYGGLLARGDREDDAAELAEHGIEPFGLVACNLYPFADTVRGGASPAEALEEIDIGGPSMIRAAAKNHPWVIPIVDPADYGGVLEALRAGGPDAARRRELAAKAFAHVAHYDAAVAEYLRGGDDPLPGRLTLGLTRAAELRYGENPHQRGAFYALGSALAPPEGVGAFEQHHGKALSYVNLLDADAALNLVAESALPAVAIVKHANPCCFAAGDAPIAELYGRALAGGDAVSAYGGIVAANRPLDLAFASALREVPSPLDGGRMFFEIVIAPGCEADGLERLRGKSRDLRILTAPAGAPRPRLEFRSLRGGMLVQEADPGGEPRFEAVSERPPTEAELADLRLAWLVARHVRSNAIALVRGGVLVGMGAGQPNRVESARLAVRGAGERAAGAALASDAFFPFPDSLEVAGAAGVTAAAHPGGSIRDADSIAAADALGMALVVTGARHFRH